MSVRAESSQAGRRSEVERSAHPLTDDAEFTAATAKPLQVVVGLWPAFNDAKRREGRELGTGM